MALSLSGNLKDTPLLDVLSILRLQKATGTLGCDVRGVGKSLYVQNGQIVFATSQDVQDRLGEVMVRAGKITRSQLTDALERHRTGDGRKKIGAYFVESGYVTPKELFNGLKLQVRSIIQSILALKDGGYRFDEVLPADVIPLQINIDELLQELQQQNPKRK
ncbi:MAG: DUF4388 domain-containing protein [Nitrospiraceae bacterium]|nr:DUF4388 domain-containing protein [Nitrospiraceae bacterium]